MKTLLALLLLCLALPPPAHLTGDFKNQVSAANLKPFALDLGGVLRRLRRPGPPAGLSPRRSRRGLGRSVPAGPRRRDPAQLRREGLRRAHAAGRRGPALRLRRPR